MPTSNPIPSAASAPADPALAPEEEVAGQTQGSEPDVLGEPAEAPESLYAMRRRRPPRWILDGSGG